MVYSTFVIASGIYTSEQNLASQLDSFLQTTTSGWHRVEVITNTGTDYDVAFYGDGSYPQEYDRSYIRIRGTGDELRFSVAAGYNETSNVFIDEITSNDTELPTGTTSGTYYFVGNSDAVFVSISGSSLGTKHFGGFGRWKTYYSYQDDPKPFYVFGHQTAANTFTSSRLLSYGVGSFGKSYETSYPKATVSGSSKTYNSAHSTDLNNAAPNPRTNQPYMFEPVFYCSTAGSREVRGEVPGLYIIGGSPYNHGSVITVSGTGSIGGKYLIHKFSNATAWAIGKIYP